MVRDIILAQVDDVVAGVGVRIRCVPFVVLYIVEQVKVAVSVGTASTMLANASRSCSKHTHVATSA